MGAAKELKELYEEDAFKWYNENAKLLRERKFDLVDIDNLAEEIESMGRYEREKLQSILIVLFLHLLKWQCQSAKQGSSWESSIIEHRGRAQDQLHDNPSLKGHLNGIIAKAYKYARLEAVQETGLPLKTFPIEMPFTIEEALRDNWLPQSEST